MLRTHLALFAKGIFHNAGPYSRLTCGCLSAHTCISNLSCLNWPGHSTTLSLNAYYYMSVVIVSMTNSDDDSCCYFQDKNVSHLVPRDLGQIKQPMILLLLFLLLFCSRYMFDNKKSICFSFLATVWNVCQIEATSAQGSAGSGWWVLSVWFVWVRNFDKYIDSGTLRRLKLKGVKFFCLSVFVLMPPSPCSQTHKPGYSEWW